ncbi:hypothetical protein, partial [Nitrosopumilus adriaticus]|uniref:hypothetical protein n=1 Tax=Nitrosopumilus adriaticus TaxID=1580092 RepID=UPI00352EFCB1
MSNFVFSLLLITVIGFGLIGIQDSFAVDYDLIDDCGTELNALGAVWTPGTLECALTDDLTIEVGDTLNLLNSAITLINTEFVITNNGEINNQGIISNEIDAELTNTGTFTNSGTFTNDGTMTNSLNDDDEAGIVNNSGTLTNSGTISNEESNITNTGTFTNSGEILDEVGIWEIDGTFNNSGDLSSNEGEFSIDGTFNNDGTLTIADNGELSISGILNNNAPLTNIIRNEETQVTISGEVNNSGTLQNVGGYNLGSGGILNNDGLIETVEDDFEFQITGELINNPSGVFNQEDGTFTIQNKVLTFGEFNVSTPGIFVIEGELKIEETSTFTNESDLELQGTGHIIIFGTFDNLGTIDIKDGTSIDILGTSGTLDNQNGVLLTDGAISISGSGTLSNNDNIELQPDGTIEILATGSFENNGTIENFCGFIDVNGGTFDGPNPPTDNCDIVSIEITDPTVFIQSQYATINFVGTAFDINEFGVSVDVSSDIVWSDDQSELNAIGSSVFHQFPPGTYLITATITDSGLNEDFDQITLVIPSVGDLDMDGYLSIPDGGEDCNDDAITVNPGAPVELVDGVDTDCNPATPLLADEEDLDTDDS